MSLPADPIIDSHTHVIASDVQRYPLDVVTVIPVDWVREHPVTAEQLLGQMDVAGVRGAVLVQARAAYGYDNSYVAQARDVDPGRLVNAAIIDMSAGDRVDQLRFWSRDKGVLGLRLFNIPAASPAWIEEPALADFVREAAAGGVRVSVCVLASDLGSIDRLLGRVDDVAIAVDHCAFADLSHGLASDGARALAALAVHDTVRLKVTTTFLETAIGAGLDPRDVMEWLCASFGPQRLMWGSDYPQHHREPYPAIVDFGRYACSRLSKPEQDQFLAGTAAQLWPELTDGP
jgi:L-fuconolactonase